MSKSRNYSLRVEHKSELSEIWNFKVFYIVQMSKLFSERHALAWNMKKDKLNRKF